jgi:hypothetical protein
MQLADDPYTGVFEMGVLSRGAIKNTALAPDPPILVPSTVKDQGTPSDATHWWIVMMRLAKTEIRMTQTRRLGHDKKQKRKLKGAEYLSMPPVHRNRFP